MMIQQAGHAGDPLPLPSPRFPITIRAAVKGDLAFIDRLQKMHTHAVGWMPTQQLEASIEQGRILIAEDGAMETQNTKLETQNDGPMRDPLSTDHAPRATNHAPLTPVGYLMGADRYFKRDDVGIIYQMNVLPAKQRGFIGAALLKAQFERSAYGCRLYCCWCAQDLPANRFWEAMGFVPLAFRTGSARKERVHIFWQKRIRAGDVTTPWWFPSQTSGGAIREDRIALPIPPGTHWSDAKPLVLPGMEGGSGGEESKALPAPRRPRVKVPKAEPLAPRALVSGGLRFADPVPAGGAKVAAIEKRELKREPKKKFDPRLVAAARELRDRWLEQVNATPLLPAGKYEVSRAIEATPQAMPVPPNLLDAA